MLKALTKLQTRIATRDKGATAVEYGLLVALIAAVIVAIVLVLGRQVSTAFHSVSHGDLMHPAGASARGELAPAGDTAGGADGPDGLWRRIGASRRI